MLPGGLDATNRWIKASISAGCSANNAQGGETKLTQG